MRILLFILCLGLALPAYADNKKETLKQIEERVAAEKMKQDEIDQKMRSLQSDMKGLKTDLIRTTGLVQKNEKELGGLEKKMTDLGARKNGIIEQISADREALAELIVALERIRRLPPQALVARPGAPLETAQASVVLGAIMPDLNRRANDFRKKLEELQDVEDSLADNKEKLKSSSEKLKENKSRMENLMAERQDNLKSAKTEFDNQAKQVAALSQKASDLKDLIKKIETQQKKKRAKSEDAPATGKMRKNKVDESKLGSSLASLGDARMPVPGTIAIKYGQPDDIGASSEGLHINARKGSTVVAPMSGVVRYAGPFKSYGSIVLLEHKNNYHSLIAGLGRIDTVVGQSVDAGEPIGTLGSTPSLYYELRYNGQPINPARKFAG